MVNADIAAMRAEDLAIAIARRDHWFGFEAGTNEPELFRAWGAEPATPSGLARPAAALGGEDPGP